MVYRILGGQTKYNLLKGGVTKVENNILIHTRGVDILEDNLYIGPLFLVAIQ